LKDIFSADVKDYSLLVGDNEVCTVTTITIYREIINDLVQKHQGREVDSPGNKILAEFSSVLNAANSALSREIYKSKMLNYLKGWQQYRRFDPDAFSRAIPLSESAIDLIPNDQDTLRYGLGKAYLFMSQFEKSTHLFERAHESNS
jgi:tetratricopeptide (TPR) repeat protein